VIAALAGPRERTHDLPRRSRYMSHLRHVRESRFLPRQDFAALA